MKFDTILQALEEGKYDISLSSFSDTRERESRFDFVTYLSAGTMLMVPKGNPRHLRPDGLSLCGKRVAVEKGTTQEEELSPKDATRPDAGTRVDACRERRQAGPDPAVLRRPGRGRPRPSRPGATPTPRSPTRPRRSTARRESGGRIQCSGTPYATALYGIAIPKRDGDLRDAVYGAMKDLISGGTYRRITARWGVSAGAVPGSSINAAK